MMKRVIERGEGAIRKSNTKEQYERAIRKSNTKEQYERAIRNVAVAAAEVVWRVIKYTQFLNYK
ncbi:hypothetical protein [Pusillimonas sp. ANT_WB101]|uniref:hypothetical protein n=1 Tax=Pusillimonas sp. ANT_WB101 TaxID=2597356 RepID=UPI0011EEBD4D|nr:hypothetical protein [Pusillimonas sp. ANT_WB101]KAA0910821.1 hypothetical protein FQ179_02815 [Pusillimonas sp. ANT_WB101]